MINVSLTKEKAINVALNNPVIQGAFDVNLLEELLVDVAQSDELKSTGYDKVDLQLLNFSPEALDGMFGEQAESEQPIIDLMGEIRETSKEYESSTAAAIAAASGGPENQESSSPAKTADEMTAEEYQEHLREKRANWVKSGERQTEMEFIATLVFNSEANLMAFLSHFDLPSDQRYFPGDEVAARCGVSLAEPG